MELEKTILSKKIIYLRISVLFKILIPTKPNMTVLIYEKKLLNNEKIKNKQFKNKPWNHTKFKFLKVF